MKKIKKGDEVIVLTGKDKGKKGKVLNCVGSEAVVVDGLNLCKKHKKPNPNANVEGGIIEISLPLHISNVALYNYATSKPSKVGFKMLAKEGRKVRYFKDNDELVDI